MNRRSQRRNKERNRYAKLLNRVRMNEKGLDPINIPNCSGSLVEDEFKTFGDKPKDIERLSLYKKQRIERGFDDTELWNLDMTIAKYVLPRLVEFKKVTNGYPPDLKTFEEWIAVIDKMIYAFDHLINEDKYDEERSKRFGITWNDYFATKPLENGNYEICKTEKYPEDAMKLYHEDKIEEGNKMQEGFDLFGKYFMSLWW